MARQFAYYPGCSLEHSSRSYDQSVRAVCKSLAIELRELEDWNCCGATSYMSIKEMVSFSISARNLSIAEEQGLPVVTPGNACFTTLTKTNHYLHEYPAVRENVDTLLASAGRKYSGTVAVHHILEILHDEICGTASAEPGRAAVPAGKQGRHAAAALIKRDVSFLNIAPYYGCQVVRPKNNLDNPELPTVMDQLLEKAGATVIPDFSLKTICCGGAKMLTRKEMALELNDLIIQTAIKRGANCIAVCCPLCQFNLEMYQDELPHPARIPVLYFTQVVGLAFGLSDKELGLDKHLITLENVLTAV